MSLEEQYQRASMHSASNLKTVARSLSMNQLSHLTLPQIDELVDNVAACIPAGNVPGIILHGLAHLPGRRISQNVIKRDLKLLFRGVEKALDTAVYGTMFMGPAAVIWGYQNLLKIAGKQPESAFPEGVWQFYVDYALREDSSRHTNETHGFDTLLQRHKISLDPVDRLTAWVMATIHILHQYNDLLANEWIERTSLSLLHEIGSEHGQDKAYATLYRAWEKQKPYGRGSDAQAGQTYADYRRQKFDEFLNNVRQQIGPKIQQEWQSQQDTVNEELPAYQQQLSILSYLESDAYGENRVSIPITNAQVGVIYKNQYYLVPVCQPGTSHPPTLEDVRSYLATLMTQPPSYEPVRLTPLAHVKRANLPAIIKKLNPTARQALQELQFAPVLINVRPRLSHLTLAEIRQAERGIGSHPLTIFDTGNTFVFDQSHIFFDGAWGAALAEIMTREALSWAQYLQQFPPPQSTSTVVYPLALQLESTDHRHIANAPISLQEVSAETDAVQLKDILSLRRLFKQRNDLLNLTVNDLLVLYRAIHALTYQPNPNLLAKLKALANRFAGNPQIQQALDSLQQQATFNPAILIPVDAGRRYPRERLYPFVFQVPLQDLNLLELHTKTLKALDIYEQDTTNPTFKELQKEYLAALAGFGNVLTQAKTVATTGNSASVGTIKLLAHMPASLQHLLSQIPNRFDVLNDLIKGSEVFSNIGAVVPSSTLTRFMTAKDDNDKKQLAWGIMTDAKGKMYITLRDSRPVITLLLAAGQRDVAKQVTQDYLNSYADGLNLYIHELKQMTIASRDTQSNRVTPHKKGRS